MPVVGAAARAEQRAIAFEALGGLLEAGRGETEALRLAADAVPSRAARVELREAAERLARGEAGLAGATGPVLGGRAGRALARALGDENAAARVGRLALREAARSEAGLLRSLALVEPLSVLLTGLLVGLAVLGGLLPVLSAVLVRW
jgi:type II secretory pathway component PulF